MDTVEVGDIVHASGHTGRFEVIKLTDNEWANLKLLAQSKIDGTPVDVGYEVPAVPISTLTLLKKKEK